MEYGFKRVLYMNLKQDIYLTKFIKEEALKDAALIERGKLRSVEWHFYKRATTGKIGPSKPLKEFLESLGIKVVIGK